MATSLEDALKGEVNPVPEEAPEMEAQTEEAAQVETEADESEAADTVSEPEPDKPKQDRPRGPDGKFAKKDKEDQEKDWSYHAYKDEKEKRQSYERELEQMRREVQTYRAQMQQQAQPKPIDPMDDPEGFTKAIDQKLQATRFEMNLQWSERMARSQFGDEAWEAANQWLRDNPQAIEQFKGSDDPCGDAVKAHRRHMAMQEIGDDPQAYRERLEAEIRERLEAERQEQAPQTPPAPQPSNFASARNAGKRNGPAWAGPTSLDNALGRAGKF
jgi:hypothetical protein